MLLSVATTMAPDMGANKPFYIASTEQISANQEDYTPGLTFMMHKLEADAHDEFTGRRVAAGTLVYAPIAFEALGHWTRPGIVDPDETDNRQTWQGRAWVYCCHDRISLAQSQKAFFYLPAMLEYLCNPGDDAHVFDPITFGTGHVAFLLHPRVKGISAKEVTSAQTSFEHVRGSRAHITAARMIALSPYENDEKGLFEFIIHHVNSICWLARLLTSGEELLTIRNRLATALARLPRKSDALLANPTNVPPALLPLGATLGLCLEGSVVQSDAAWAVRQDPRVRLFFDHIGGRDPDPANTVYLDLPLVLFTPESHQKTFENGVDPIFTLHSGPIEAVTHTGVFSVGIAALPVWTLTDPSATIPQELIPAISRDGRLRYSTSLPIAFTVEWTIENRAPLPEVAVTDRRDLYTKLLQVNTANARVLFSFPGGFVLRLTYVRCSPGSAFLVDAVKHPLISLPPMGPLLRDAPTDNQNQLAIGLQLARTTTPHDTDMPARLREGRCPEVDLYGRYLRDEHLDPEEQRRLANLRPAVEPYTRQGADPWTWDARVQNPAFAMPYFASHAPIKLPASLSVGLISMDFP